MPEIASVQERRTHVRVSCAIVESQGHLIWNLSREGACFETDRDFPSSQDFLLDLHEPISGKRLHLKAKVKWRKELPPNRYGYGVQFQKLTPAEERDIDSFLISEEFYAKVRGVLFEVIPDELKDNFRLDASVITDMNVDSLKVAEVAILLEQAFGQVIFLPDWFISEENPEALSVGSLVRFLLKNLQNLD